MISISETSKDALNQSKPFFSVIIPTYNRPACLQRSVNSALEQGAFVEVLVIDDCSLQPVANQWEHPPARLTLIRNNKRLGPGMSRNRGMAVARGKYLVFLDDDDFLVQNSLKKMMDAIASLNFPTFVCGESRRFIGEPKYRDDQQTISVVKFGNTLEVLTHFFPEPGTFAVRTDVTLWSGNFAKRDMNAEDLDFVIRLSPFGACYWLKGLLIAMKSHGETSHLSNNFDRAFEGLAVLVCKVLSGGYDHLGHPRMALMQAIKPSVDFYFAKAPADYTRWFSCLASVARPTNYPATVQTPAGPIDGVWRLLVILAGKSILLFGQNVRIWIIKSYLMMRTGIANSARHSP